MKISVVIPTYNSAAVIRLTLDSVLRQTVPPHEILVLDDGSTDDTVSILNSYAPKVSVIRRSNRGVAAARNELSRLATGDLVAFLDHDDLWHPRYLEVQSQSFAAHPSATACFTYHEDFHGSGNHTWAEATITSTVATEIISPVDFLKRYNNSTGAFYSMSFCCVPKAVLTALGEEPFWAKASGVDDCYLCNLFPLHGPVAFTPLQLVAYRITENAQSVNQLKNFKLVVDVFAELASRYRAAGNAKLLREFNLAFAGKRRRYGKTLMGAGLVSEAQQQFKRSAGQSANPASLAKSAALLGLSYLPTPLQPRWPASQRRSPQANTLPDTTAKSV